MPEVAVPAVPEPHSAEAAEEEGWLTPATRSLFQAVLALEDLDEAERFFRDLCTVQELRSLAARWEVARLLEDGVHYQEIARRTGASTATITRVNTWLRYGRGGYRLALDRARRPRSRRRTTSR